MHLRLVLNAIKMRSKQKRVTLFYYLRMSTNLIFRSENLELIVDERILCRLFLAKCPLFLQLWTPKRLNAVHTGPQFLCGGVQFALNVAILTLQLIASRLQFHHKIVTTGVMSGIGDGMA